MCLVSPAVECPLLAQGRRSGRTNLTILNVRSTPESRRSAWSGANFRLRPRADIRHVELGGTLSRHSWMVAQAAARAQANGRKLLVQEIYKSLLYFLINNYIEI